MDMFKFIFVAIFYGSLFYNERKFRFINNKNNNFN